MKSIQLEHIRSMAHSALHNYAIPGLTSSLLGGAIRGGTVRLFECSRQHHESIIPHNHRFDFQCLVLAGRVKNTTWLPAEDDDEGDEYAESVLTYEGEPGHYAIAARQVRRYQSMEEIHHAGQWYGMRAQEIHSIHFDRGTSVLFFEGPTISDTTTILEPFVNGERVPTFKVEDWMFQKGSAA